MPSFASDFISNIEHLNCFDNTTLLIHTCWSIAGRDQRLSLQIRCPSHQSLLCSRHGSSQANVITSLPSVFSIHPSSIHHPSAPQVPKDMVLQIRRSREIHNSFIASRIARLYPKCFTPQSIHPPSLDDSDCRDEIDHSSCLQVQALRSSHFSHSCFVKSCIIPFIGSTNYNLLRIWGGGSSAWLQVTGENLLQQV